MRRLRYLVTGAQAPRAAFGPAFPIGPALFFAVISGLAGCGPIEYLNQVSGKAAGAVAAAKRADAERFAPYEYTAAVEYLHKAREEGGSAEYQVAIEYGEKAERLATRALALAMAGERAASRSGAGGGDGDGKGHSAEPPFLGQDSH